MCAQVPPHWSASVTFWDYRHTRRSIISFHKKRKHRNTLLPVYLFSKHNWRSLKPHVKGLHFDNHFSLYWCFYHYLRRQSIRDHSRLPEAIDVPSICITRFENSARFAGEPFLNFEQRTKFRNGLLNRRCHFKSMILALIDVIGWCGCVLQSQ